MTLQKTMKKTLMRMDMTYKKHFGNVVEKYKVTKVIPTTPDKRHAFLIALAHNYADEMGLFLFAAEQYLADLFKPEKKAKLIVDLFLKPNATKEINSSKSIIKPAIAALLLGNTDEAERLLQLLMSEQRFSMGNTVMEENSFKAMLQSLVQPNQSFVKAIQDLKTPLQQAGFDTYTMGVW